MKQVLGESLSKTGLNIEKEWPGPGVADGREAKPRPQGHFQGAAAPQMSLKDSQQGKAA